MVWRLFSIRAEYPGNDYEDFQIGGESLESARAGAESRILARYGLPRPSIEWRGQVMFVERRP